MVNQTQTNPLLFFSRVCKGQFSIVHVTVASNLPDYRRCKVDNLITMRKHRRVKLHDLKGSTNDINNEGDDHGTFVYIEHFIVLTQGYFNPFLNTGL